ncbi:hypothetical protein KJ853_01360 [Patescibacteria group bacterium]|nr:hypothetical protein [Patescibacteria group bacterium]
MRVIIPKFIKKEIERITRGKPKKKPKKKQYPKEKLLSMANSNLEFLNKLAETEPIHSLLQKRGVLTLDEFSPQYPDIFGSNGSKPQGGLWLETIQDKTALFYWLDADYPVNRSDRDHVLVTQDKLAEWHIKSLDRFALLTKKEIWANIAHFMQSMP